MIGISYRFESLWDLVTYRHDGMHNCMIADRLWLSRRGPLFTQIYSGCIVKSYAVFSCLAISLAAWTER